jgi:hypothetical protein
MRPELTYNSLHNPFNNRFNYPVTCRRDEMQAYAHKAWLRERNQCGWQTQSNSKATPPSVIFAKQTASSSDAFDPKHWGRLYASVIAAFLFLLVSAAALLKAL